MDEIKIIEKKYLSNDTGTCIEGLKLSSDIIKELTSISLKLIENDQLDTLYIVEHISTFFNDFLNSLKKIFDSDNENLRFWVSTLLIHYSIKDLTKAKAEDVLLETIKHGDLEKAELAATILKRDKNINLSEAILIRLLDKNKLDDKVINFFKEKL